MSADQCCDYTRSCHALRSRPHQYVPRPVIDSLEYPFCTVMHAVRIVDCNTDEFSPDYSKLGLQRNRDADHHLQPSPDVVGR